MYIYSLALLTKKWHMYICHFSGIGEPARGGITGEEPQYLQKRVDIPFSPVFFFLSI